MEFRWIILLVLWTFLIGPVVDDRGGGTASPRNAASAAKNPKR